MATSHFDTNTTSTTASPEVSHQINGSSKFPFSVLAAVPAGSNSPTARLPTTPGSPQLYPSSGSRLSAAGRLTPRMWERSQSAAELDQPARFTTTSTLECGQVTADGPTDSGNKVSEHASVYWDLSTAVGTAMQGGNDDESRNASASNTVAASGKFTISLQTIHQKEQITQSSGMSTSNSAPVSSSNGPSSPSISFQTRFIRHVSSESSASSTTTLLPSGSGGTIAKATECSQMSLPAASVEFPLPSSQPSLLLSESPPCPGLPPQPPSRYQSDDGIVTGADGKSLARLTFTYSNSASGSNISSLSAASSATSTPSLGAATAKQNLAATLTTAVPAMRDVIRRLRSSAASNGSLVERCQTLQDMLQMIQNAWSTPTIGRDVAYALCDLMRTEGGLDALLSNCDVDSAPSSSLVQGPQSSPQNGSAAEEEVQLRSARVLAESMTVSNRDYVARGRGLEIVVRLAGRSRENPQLSLATTGILESLFKHSQATCATLIRLGGLDAVLYSCRRRDEPALRRCAVALANLAIYGGPENQQAMIEHNAADWLFPLAFSDDDSTRYYAFLAIAALSANSALESAVIKSGTLCLVEPFIRAHDPIQFGQSDASHMHGQSSEWLRRLVPLLECRRVEAQSLAAFHFAMEASIRAEQGKLEVFRDIEAIEPLKRLAAGTEQLAAGFASQALQIIGEDVPHKLPPQVPLWTSAEVVRWLEQTGVVDGDVIKKFDDCRVDGDLLLTLNQEHLRDDLKLTNGVTRLRFMRDLIRLKQTADYDSCDPTKLDDWLNEIGGRDFRQYTYQMVKAGVDRRILRVLTDDHLSKDCGILNGVHRLKILDAAKRMSSMACSPLCVGGGNNPVIFDKPIDVFISYRRSTGSQLASLLKVHLQLRGLTVFLDIEKLRAGKFDDNLLNSVHNARNFLLVLTPNSLDRCIGDTDRKDWVHREIVAALEGGCNIIPIMDNFQWPATDALPEDMRSICTFNSIRWIHDYQDACVDKLENFITGGEASASNAAKGPLSLFRPSMSKASSLSSPNPEFHGGSCPLPIVSEGPQPMAVEGTAPFVTPRHDNTVRLSGQTRDVPNGAPPHLPK